MTTSRINPYASLTPQFKSTSVSLGAHCPFQECSASRMGTNCTDMLKINKRGLSHVNIHCNQGLELCQKVYLVGILQHFHPEFLHCEFFQVFYQQQFYFKVLY